MQSESLQQDRDAEQTLDSVLTMLQGAQLKQSKRFSVSSVPIIFTDEVQYLIFMLTGSKRYEATDPYSSLDKEVKELVDRVGTAGTQKRKLGFGIVIPVWTVEKAYPGKTGL